MAGLTAGAPTPEALTLHGQSRALEISFSDGRTFRIPFELMRVYSPSAEVQGHGPGQEVLQTGKREVDIVELAQVGNYGEVFDRNLGAGSPLELKRGPNALWTQGGLMYAPPLR